jgi:hypothetical protein
MNAIEYKIDLEPVAFTGREYDERLGIVAEIINTGIEIPIQDYKNELPEVSLNSYRQAFELEYTHNSTANGGNTLTL